MTAKEMGEERRPKTAAIMGVLLLALSVSGIAFPVQATYVNSGAAGLGTISGCGGGTAIGGFVSDQSSGVITAFAGDPIQGGFLIVLTNLGVASGGVACGSNVGNAGVIFSYNVNCVAGTLSMTLDDAGTIFTFSSSLARCGDAEVDFTLGTVPDQTLPVLKDPVETARITSELRHYEFPAGTGTADLECVVTINPTGLDPCAMALTGETLLHTHPIANEPINTNTASTNAFEVDVCTGEITIRVAGVGVNDQDFPHVC